MQNCVKDNLSLIRKIYQKYAHLWAHSLPDNTTAMCYFQFCQLLKDCDLLKIHDLASVDRFIAKSYGHGEPIFSQNPERLFPFGAFVNILAILACNLSVPDENDTGNGSPNDNPSLVLERMVTECLAPNIGKKKRLPFDCPENAQAAVNLLQPTWDLYQFVVSSLGQIRAPVRTIKMRQFIFLLHDLKLLNKRLPVNTVIEILCSNNPSIGLVSECDLDREMTFFDFFEALVHCAHVRLDENAKVEPENQEKHLEDRENTTCTSKQQQQQSEPRKTKKKKIKDHRILSSLDKIKPELVASDFLNENRKTKSTCCWKPWK